MNYYTIFRRTAIAVLLAPLFTAYQTHAQQLLWTELAGPVGGSVRSMAKGEGILYAGMTYGSVFRSTDGGASWRRTASAPAPGRNVASLITTSGGDLFAATDDGSVYRSANRGDSWLQVRTSWEKQYSGFPTLAVGTDDQIFLGAEWGALYSSTDLGATWTVNTISDVTIIAPISSTEIYIGATTGWYRGTLYRSTDQGSSWDLVHTRTQSEAITGIVRIDGMLIAGTQKNGIIRSSDEGATWSASNNGFNDDLDVRRLLKLDSTSLVALMSDGLYLSRDAGEGWTPLAWTASYSSPNVFLSINDSILLVGNNGGGIERIELGTERLEETNEGLHAQEITSIMPLTKARIVAGTIAGGIYVSTDDGASWNRSSAPPQARQSSRLARLSSGTLLSSSSSCLLRSTDNGASWSKSVLPEDILSEIEISPEDRAIVATQNHGYFTSSDDGTTWRQMILHGTLHPSQPVQGMTFTATGRLVIATRGGGEGIFVADLIDDTLRFTSFTPEYIQALDIAPNGILYGTHAVRGLVYSSDEGTTWLPFITPPDSSFTALLVTPAGDLVTGTKQGNIWVLPNGSAAWTRETTGLIGMPIAALVNDSRGDILAGTLGGGIFRSRISLSTPETDILPEVQLLSAGPNPCWETFALRFDLAHESHVRITLTDVLGRPVAAEWSQEFSQGAHTTTLDMSSFPSGNYLCRIVAGQSVLTKELTVLR